MPSALPKNFSSRLYSWSAASCLRPLALQRTHLFQCSPDLPIPEVAQLNTGVFPCSLGNIQPSSRFPQRNGHISSHISSILQSGEVQALASDNHFSGERDVRNS